MEGVLPTFAVSESLRKIVELERITPSYAPCLHPVAKASSATTTRSGARAPRMAPTQRVAVKVPPGMVAGQAIQFTAPGGGTFTATIPQGVQPGGTFLVEVAAAAAPPMAQAVPMQAPTPAGQSAAATDFVPMGLPVDEEPLPSSSYPAVPSRPAVPPRAQSLYNCLSTPASAPSPAAPRSATPPSASRPTAVKHAECPICFEPLHQAPVGVFLDRQGRRTSTLDTDPNTLPRTLTVTLLLTLTLSGSPGASRATSSTSPPRRSGRGPQP